MSSIWQLSFEKGAASSQRCIHSIWKWGRDSHLLLIFIPFQYISSKIFTNQALWKHFCDCLNHDAFILWMLIQFLIGWGGKIQTHVYASIWLEDSFGSILRWDHTVLVEEILFLCTVSSGTALAFLRNFPQFYHFSTVYTYLMVIFHSLSEKFQLWGIKYR